MSKIKKLFSKIPVIAFLMCCCVPSLAAAETVKLDLDEAINLALKNNRSIEQAAADRESARWGLSAARRNAGPRLNWSMNSYRVGGRYYDRYRMNRYVYDATAVLYDAQYGAGSFYAQNGRILPSYTSENTNTLSLSYQLYGGGDLENRRKSAGYRLNVADLTSETVRQDVKLRVARAYFQVLQYGEMMKVRTEETGNLEEHLRTVQIQYEVGTAPLSDVLATSVSIADSKQNYNNAKTQYLNAVATLNNIIGLPVDSELKLGDDLKTGEPFKVDEETCLEYAFEHRPDGKAALYALKSSRADVGQAKSGYRPVINAVLSGTMAGEGAFKADHSPEQWSAGIQLNWSIFDNRVTSAQVKQAKAAEKKAESAAKQQLEQIRLDVRNAYVNVKNSEFNIKLSFDAIKNATEQWQIAKIRYEEGVDTNLVVMDAQEKLTRALTNHLTALYNYKVSKAELDKAMGVPVLIDASIYAAAVEEGKVADKALNESKIGGD